MIRIQSYTARIQPFRFQRFYAAFKRKLWVEDKEAAFLTQVSTKGCQNIDDFIKNVKLEFNARGQLTLHTSIDDPPLSPHLKLSSVSKINSGTEPLYFMRVQPPRPPRKRILLRKADEEDYFTDEYITYNLENSDQLAWLIESGKCLVCLSKPHVGIISFEDLQDGEKYQEVRNNYPCLEWVNYEADSMEVESKQSVIKYLEKKYGVGCIDLPSYITDPEKLSFRLQEWDAVLYHGETHYLLKAKHSVLPETLETFRKEVKYFPLFAVGSAQGEIFSPYIKGKIVGVACGTIFPKDIRAKALEQNIGIVVSSGEGYEIEGL